ncbi:PREDICTED: E3 ubiquitin-protein ligase SINA-like 7 [Camelina sativa]|uniref:E3 ubiquitin-protein ligase SINA-like 7 n=1 Tax=Camelina sativa TaxID=90675 RepID=A0ABM1REK8_CAMSA|nr:PREDICTED: E3 ubiquitin-protein ligase SINA-like 7 [Camelina sativa]
MECPLSLCICPVLKCNYNGIYKHLYSHLDIHNHENIGKYYFPFALGKVIRLYVDLSETALTVMKEKNEGLLFAVHRVSKANGVVTVGCIAPSLLEVTEFFYDISTTVEKRTIEIKPMKVKNIRKLNSKIPKENFMLVPSYFMCEGRWFMLKICVSKVNQEKECCEI